ncbi:hypothetical protein J1779_00830, partial [Rahnella sp. FC061912-K]|uniref:hypothetical protein n=1 Tax=Rahnella rivi TaxID=2816249 RepID=UPI001C25179E
ARYRSRAMFQGLALLPQNPAASRCPPLGLQPAQTDARFSTTPSGVIFERGQWLCHSKDHRDLSFELKSRKRCHSFRRDFLCGHWHFKIKGNVFGFASHSLWPRSKRRRMNGEKPRGCFSERVPT